MALISGSPKTHCIVELEVAVHGCIITHTGILEVAANPQSPNMVHTQTYYIHHFVKLIPILYQ